MCLIITFSTKYRKNLTNHHNWENLRVENYKMQTTKVWLVWGSPNGQWKEQQTDDSARERISVKMRCEKLDSFIQTEATRWQEMIGISQVGWERGGWVTFCFGSLWLCEMVVWNHVVQWAWIKWLCIKACFKLESDKQKMVKSTDM